MIIESLNPDMSLGRVRDKLNRVRAWEHWRETEGFGLWRIITFERILLSGCWGWAARAG